MADRRWRAVRFDDPGLVSIAGAGGLGIAPTGALAMAEGDDAVRQAILLLLTTRQGERVMRPSYGSLLHRLVFAPNDDTTAGLAIHYVRQALARWEPRVEALAIDAGVDPDAPERLLIELTYRVKVTQAIESLVLLVGIQEESLAS